MKRTILIILVLTLLIPISFVHAEGNIKIYVDNNQLSTNGFIVNGSTVVPLRSIFEALGAEVEWDGTTQTVISTKENTTIKLTIGKSIAIINGNSTTLTVPAQIIKGSTYVPLRFVGESFGAIVQWDDKTQSVFIATSVLDISSAQKKIVGSLDEKLINLWSFETVQDDWIYYRKNFEEQKDLYRMRVDGSEVTKVEEKYVYSYSDNRIIFIPKNKFLENLYNDKSKRIYDIKDDWVYFSEDLNSFLAKNYRYYLSRAKNDGTGYQIILDSAKFNDGSLTFFGIIDDNIYLSVYKNKLSTVYRMKTDGSNLTKIIEDVELIEGTYTGHIKEYEISYQSSSTKSYIIDNSLYYYDPKDSYSFYKINLDGTNPIKLTDKPVVKFFVDNDWIIYNIFTQKGDYSYINGPIYKIKKDGTSNTLVRKEMDFLSFALNGWIYFGKHQDNNLWKVKYDNTQETKLTNSKEKLVYNRIIGDWLIFDRYLDISYQGSNIMKVDGTHITKGPN